MDGPTRTPRETLTFVALGGNLGNVADRFQRAVEDLAAIPGIRVGRISSNHATPAVGKNAGGGFLNAAAELFTTLSPHALLQHLHAVETKQGRARHVRRGPRTLDLDLLFYGDEIIETGDLQLPHPACWYRRFVLDPLAEIAGDAIHPEKHLSIDELRERLLVRPLSIGLCGATAEIRSELQRELSADASECTLIPDWSAADDPPAILFWLGLPPCASPVTEFQALPLAPRLDASISSDTGQFQRDELQAALGR